MLETIIDKKINELKVELAKQQYSVEDEAEIEKIVQEYKKELVDSKKDEYAFNQEIIKARIETLEELREENEANVKVAEESPISTVL